MPLLLKWGEAISFSCVYVAETVFLTVSLLLLLLLLSLLCIEEAHGEAVRFFSPRCHIMPKWAQYYCYYYHYYHYYYYQHCFRCCGGDSSKLASDGNFFWLLLV